MTPISNHEADWLHLLGRTLVRLVAMAFARLIFVTPAHSQAVTRYPRSGPYAKLRLKFDELSFAAFGLGQR